MPNLIEYGGVRPTFAVPPVAALPGHVVIGRATIGKRAWLGAGSVIRADGHFIKIGDDLHLGRGATIHVAHDLYPTVIGNRVCIGVGAVVHACTVADDVSIGQRAVILDGSVVETGCVLADDSLVYPRSTLKAGVLYAGRPAVATRQLASDEILGVRRSQRVSNLAADAGWLSGQHTAEEAYDVFVARSCSLNGEVHLADGSSVWFSSRLNALDGAISIGPYTNIQDNSILEAGHNGIVIGSRTTIGHNVDISESKIGSRCLVGIGSYLAPHTVIDDDNFLAAGSSTQPGQRLPSGWLWGGRPARQLGRLSEAKRILISDTSTIYHDYAQYFNHAPYCE